jgi:hypothetical protein
MRATSLTACGIAAALSLLPNAAASPLLAQAISSRVFHVRETAGIRRTEYPVSLSVQLPRGALRDAAHARVTTGGAEVAAQFTAASAWEDGSIQTLDIDLNASLDPEQDRRYELQYGEGIASSAAPARGLTVDERADAIVVGNLTFSRSGTPLLAAATYRGDGIATGANGVTITDSTGVRHDLTSAQNQRLEVVKRGPLLVALRFTASIPLNDATSVPIELLLEMPNSKTWLKTTATVADRSRRLRDIALERPYAWSRFPVLWDFGTDSGTYGVFRAATDVVTLTQTASDAGPSAWRIESGAGDRRQTIELSSGSRGRSAGGWGHVHDENAAVAFAWSRFGRDAGTSTITLAGSGQTTFRFAPAAPSTQLQLVLYEHFVATPIAIGAATNPTSMVTPPVVTIDR